MTQASDNFQRSGPGLGPNWTSSFNTAPVISNNGFTNGTGTSDNDSPRTDANQGCAFWNASAFSNDHSAEITITAVGANGTDCAPGVGVRMSAGQGYFLWAGRNTTGFASNFQVEVWVSTAPSTSSFLFGFGGPSGTTVNVGDKIKLSIVNQTLTAYFNNVKIFETTDISLASGAPGIIVGLGSPPGDHPAQTTIGSNWFAKDEAGGNVYTPLASNTFLGTPGALQDSFPYANGDLHTLNSNWAYQGSSAFQVSSHVALSNAAGVDFAYRSDLSPTPDQWGYTVVNNAAGGAQTGIALRVSSSQPTAYVAQLVPNGTPYRISKDVNGAFSVLFSGSNTPQEGDVFALKVVGTALTLYLNGVQVGTATDSSIASGNVGLFGVGTATTGASVWAAGNFNLPGNFQGSNGFGWVVDPNHGAFLLYYAGGTSAGTLIENSVDWLSIPDQYASAIVSGNDGSPALKGPGVRIQPGTTIDGYFMANLSEAGPTLGLYKYVNNVKTVLASIGYTAVQGDAWQIEVKGTTILGRLNGVPVLIATDSDFSTGYAGLVVQYSVAPQTRIHAVNNWVAGSISVPSSSPRNDFGFDFNFGF